MHEEPEIVQSTTHSSETLSHDSGMFSRSRHFTVTGQNLTNITNHNYTPPTLRSDFRMIPMGDIDLRQEIRVDECISTGMVNLRCKRSCARRVHSSRARITGSESNVTVAVYQGKDAEEAWRQDIAKYIHPNIIQICAAASSNGIHAMLFNDELIPLKQYAERSRHSPCLMIFIYACCSIDFIAVHGYIYSSFSQLLHPLECTSWIRCSTGRLCTELAPSKESVWLHKWQHIPELPGIHTWDLPHAKSTSMAIESLTIEQYHHICEMNLARHRHLHISGSALAAKLGSVFCCSSKDLLENLVEIASFFNLDAHPGRWSVPDGVGEFMNEGWTRFRSSDISNTTISLVPILSLDLDPWLSQANQCWPVYLRSVAFELNIAETTEDAPAGFLFLCPEHDLQTGRLSFCWPDQERAAYWSLDPTGVGRLSAEEASQLGFPALRLTATVTGDFWDAGVYEGLRQFHYAKGFDPDSQDLARNRGWPLYQLSSDIDAPSACVYGEGYDVDPDSGTADASDDELEHSPTSDVDVDGEALATEDNHDIVGNDCATSECIEMLKCHPADPVCDGMASLSPTFKFLIDLQLVLFLFLGFSSLYAHI
ncbi:hypothetical protein MSAN_00131300 [Mycena sanguinolenta]|uniref:Uncharacterized protein n=1 Tax=Mycena sanguinolenta TaxID=230812 RepID=A0A8H6ZDT2_9AGAR|nr:hypothetical protein MSAN_00131300 [Mycena sanguinolenta]